MTHAELDALLPAMTERVSKVRVRCFSIFGEQSGATTVDKFIALLLLDIVRARLAPPRRYGLEQRQSRPAGCSLSNAETAMANNFPSRTEFGGTASDCVRATLIDAH